MSAIEVLAITSVGVLGLLGAIPPAIAVGALGTRTAIGFYVLGMAVTLITAVSVMCLAQVLGGDA